MGKTATVPSGCGANPAILRSRPRPWSHQSLRARPRLDGFSLATPSIPVVLADPNLPQTIAIIGAGPLGRWLALGAPRAGFHVLLEDVMPSNLHHASESIRQQL